MPWNRSRPGGSKTAAKYRSKQHRDDVKRYRDELEAAGSGVCAEVVCLKRTRLILPGMDLHLCHNRRTGEPLGLGHADCNRSEAGRHARMLRDSTRLTW